MWSIALINMTAFFFPGPLLSSSFTSRMNGPVNVHGIECNGHESSLSECDWSEAIGSSSCYHGEDVGLTCSGTAYATAYATYLY